MTGDETLAARTPHHPDSLTRHVVVMGVAGCGKTTVARALSEATGLVFAEADDFHSQANVDKMRSGVPLDDEDRWPWLLDLADWMAQRAAEGRSTVIACSALKRAYRDTLRTGAPGVSFVHLDHPVEVIRDRLRTRAGHYMPASLLDSQVETLEPLQQDEHGIVDVGLDPEHLVALAARRLGLPLVERRPT